MQRKSVALASAFIGIVASTMTAFAAPKDNNKIDKTPNWTVIQGSVVSVDHNMVTVKTLDWQPGNGLGVLDPSVIYTVNVARALEETYSGNVVRPQIQTGEVIVVFGKFDWPKKNGHSVTLSTSPILTALVIELASGGNVNTNNSVTETSLRIPFR